MWAPIFGDGSTMNDPQQPNQPIDAAERRLGSRRLERLSAVSKLWLACMASLVSLGQVRLINTIVDFGKSAEAMRGVYDGMPGWRVFQSRVLAPYLIEGLRGLIGIRSSVAYNVYAFLLLVAAGLLAYALGNRLAGRLGGALAFVTLHLGFALLLSAPWLYAWDFINVCVFLLFAYFVATQKPYPWFVALFFAGLLNHEAVVFIACWLIIDPLARSLLTGRALEWRPLAAGVACIVCGVVIVETLRTMLLVRETYSRDWFQTGSAHFFAIENVKILVEAFSHSTLTVTLTALPLLAAIVALAVALAIRHPRLFLGYALVHLVMVAALLVFGVLAESRIYLSLVPFVVLATVVLCTDPNEPSLAAGP